MFSDIASQHFFVSSIVEPLKVRGIELTNQELVDGHLITSSCPPLVTEAKCEGYPSSDEEVLLKGYVEEWLLMNRTILLKLFSDYNTQLQRKELYSKSQAKDSILLH